MDAGGFVVCIGEVVVCGMVEDASLESNVLCGTILAGTVSVELALYPPHSTLDDGGEILSQTVLRLNEMFIVFTGRRGCCSSKGRPFSSTCLLGVDLANDGDDTPTRGDLMAGWSPSSPTTLLSDLVAGDVAQQEASLSRLFMRSLDAFECSGVL